jgi:hypothetical protein
VLKLNRSRREIRAERLEDRRLLSATLSVTNTLGYSNTLMAFNAVENSTASQTETLTLTDSGSTTLSLNSVSIVNDPNSPTQDAARFTILNSASIPTSLSPGQSFGLQLSYKAIAHVINSAFLDISTNDPVNPTQQIALRGIGAIGLGGSNQPSLAMILQAYEIPTLVGDGPDDSGYLTDGTYPNPPDPTSQEVVLQTLQKAGPGPVTIQTLASFTASGTKPYTLGMYTPGNPNTADLHELFFTPSSESQSVYVQPDGTTSFDPGSSQFGFYFVSNVQVQGRIGYSEDALNTWDTTNDRKFRFFPMETSNGTVVPNTFIMTTTEWNAPAGYDFTNIVAVVSNVKAATGAPTGPVLGLDNENAVPGSSTMLFNRIQNQNTTVGDTVHDTGVLQIENTGTNNLVISSITLNSSAWELVNAPTLPYSLAGGGIFDLQIKFIATTEPSHSYNETDSNNFANDGGVYFGTLTISSNDQVNPTKTVPLAGYWQDESEHEMEPSLQTLVNLMAGWSTDINPTPISTLDESLTSASTPTYYGEEVVSPYWQEADPSVPVQVTQFDSWHTQGNTAELSWFAQGSTSTHELFITNSDNGQTLFPLVNAGTVAAGSFSTTSAFGFKIDGNSSDDSQNNFGFGNEHDVRFYPLRDASGNLVPNTYLMAMDYPAVGTQNFDFQDNVYIISNIHPVTVTAGVAAPQTTAAPAAPTDLYAVAGQSGGVSLEWAPVIGDSTLQGYNVYSSLSPTGGFSLLNSSPMSAISYTDTTAPAGTTVYYQVTAVDSVGQSLGIEASATTVGTASIGLQSTDIGAVPSGSTTVVTPGSAFTIVAGGPGVSGTIDGFRYVFDSQTGNFDVQAQIDSLTVAGNFSTAGIMARSTLNTNSPNVYMAASPVNDRFKYRPTAGGTTTIITGPNVTFPDVWVRLTRVGNLFTGYTSTDGTNWTVVSTVTLSLPTTLYLGLAVASNDTTDTTTAQISGYAATPVGPFANNDAFSAITGQGVVLNVLSNDTDATSTLVDSSVTITTQPNEGGSVVVDLSTGQITYTSSPGFTGTETFSYTVADANGDVSSPATVTMSVADALSGPVAGSVTASAVAGQPKEIDVLVSDSDGTGTIVPGSILIVSSPNQGGTASLDTNTDDILYTPAVGFSGVETFTYSVQDKNGITSQPGTVTVNVTLTAVAPTTVNDSFTAVAGQPELLDVLANDTGDIDPTTVAIVSPPNHGGVATPNLTTGEINYTAVAGFTGVETFTYTVSDHNGDVSAPAVVTVTVTALSPTAAPVANNDSAVVLENSAVNIDVLANDIPATTFSLSTIMFSQPADGTLALNSDGSLTYTPNSNFVGSDSFTYTVADNNGNTSNSATVNVNVGVEISSAVGGNHSIVYTDADGTQATVSLNRGVADVYFSGSGTAAPATGAGRVLIGNGTDLQIADIVLKNTTAASALTITGAKGGAISLGGVADTGTIGKINGKTANLSGTINVGGLSSLLLGNISNSQLQIGSGVNHVAITVGAVTDSTLQSSVPITALKASSWTVSGTAVQITAPTIGSLIVAGEFDPGISLAGSGTAVTLSDAKITGLVDLGQWDITGRAGTIVVGSVGSAWNGVSVSGLLSSFTVKSGDLSADVSAGSIGTLKVVGEISNANISTTGDIVTLTAGSVSGSTISAGTGGNASFSTTTAANIGGSTIHSIHLTAKTDTFSDSTIAADSILAAALGAVNTDNGGTPEGLIGVKFKSVSVTINGSAVHLGAAQLASDATLAAYLAAKDVSFSDLTIQIL